jgi:hypothetical protein
MELVPLKYVIMACSLEPYLIRAITVVTGITPTGRIGLPMRLFMKELFPALNCPRMAKSMSGFFWTRSSHTSIWRLREMIPNLEAVSTSFPTSSS